MHALEWALTASLHWTTLRDVRMQRRGAYLHDQIHVVLLIGLFFAVPLGVAGAQQPGPPPFARSIAQPGEVDLYYRGPEHTGLPKRFPVLQLSVRRDDRSPADSETCPQRCCNNFRVCLSIRGCSNLTAMIAFSPTSPDVRALRAKEGSSTDQLHLAQGRLPRCL